MAVHVGLPSHYYGPSSAPRYEGDTWNWSSEDQDVLVQMIQKAQESAQYARQLRSLQSCPDSKPPVPLLSLFTQDWDEGEENELWSMTDPQYRESHLSGINVSEIRAMQNVNGFYDAVYGLASFFNHSCIPNCMHYPVADHLFVSSTRRVKAGEELLIDYFSPLTSTIYRQVEGSTQFLCDCPRCEFEGLALETIPDLNTLATVYHALFETGQTPNKTDYPTF